MAAVTVSTFHYDVIRRRHIYCRWTNNWLFLSAKVSSKENAGFCVAGRMHIRNRQPPVHSPDRNICKRRTKNMSRVKKFQLNIRCNIHLAVIRKGNNLVGAFYNIVFVKNRPPAKFFAFFAGLFCKELSIPRLNTGTVHHDKVCNITGCRSGINISGKAFFCKNRQKSTVVIMSVGQNNRFKFISCYIKISIFFVRNLSMPLKRTAVNHKRSSINLKHMF